MQKHKLALMANFENKSIGVFIDGGYFAKVNEALERQMKMSVNIKTLFRFIPELIGQLDDMDSKKLFITESHYYRGRYRVNDAQNKHLLFSERLFEDSLIENDIIIHYKHLREVERDGQTEVVEKGVDVWFALEAYELATFRKFDYVVLITGDADHEMLVRKLKALKIKTVLLTWNLSDVDATSPLLRDEAGQHWELSSMTDENPQLKRMLLYKLREPAVTPLGDEF